ncbi:uncharacterized protein LOC124806093 [Hydra vulgaris]|uniref:uncharacterized protein LOC124806093 n=1 Tax=Hydra vulgaris TaxID=6087 RepID=UPI001F5FC8D1|nr:uncharacterized protein LOC124806093 [Hydra vulgaris]
MRRLLNITVNEMFGKKNLPSKTNRRFYPRTDIIHSHMVKERLKQRYSNIDQDCLEIKIKEWKEADSSVNIYFRPKERGNSAELLFVYQAFWQKKLLKKYGNEVLFLDATYKTTRYSLPLVFLVVKTNVHYQIVATFVRESETFESISEALVILKPWDEDLQLLYCMTDYCNAEIRALKTILLVRICKTSLVFIYFT